MNEIAASRIMDTICLSFPEEADDPGAKDFSERSFKRYFLEELANKFLDEPFRDPHSIAEEYLLWLSVCREAFERFSDRLMYTFGIQAVHYVIDNLLY